MRLANCRITGVFVAMFFAFCIAPSAWAGTVFHPVAAAKPQNGSVFVLTTEGTIFAVNMGPTSGSVAGRFTFPLAGYPNDMAYGVVGSEPMLFVGSNSSTGGIVQGRVQQFTTNGRPVRSWTTRHIVAGLAFDSTGQNLYFTSGDTPEVYVIGMGPNQTARFVAEITGGTKLGSLSVDAARQKLYVSDLEQGTIFGMSLGNKLVTALARVGTPQAQALAPDASQLAVADSARKQIVSLALGSPTYQVRSITAPGSFGSPTGLAWGDPTHLLLADELKGSIFLIDAAGKTVYSVVLH